MRIRKHAKISPLLYYASSSSVIQTHVCQLNQSPWDVLSFPPPDPSPPPTPPPPFPVDKDRSYLANGFSSSDHISAGESVGEGYDNGETKKFEQGEGVPLSLKKIEEEEDKIFCSKIDGKGWQCKKKVKNGQSFCDYHSAQPWVKKSTESRRSRGARPKNPAPSSKNPYEYYYYSGFGPRWGKKRGAAAAAPLAIEKEHCTSHDNSSSKNPDTNHTTSIIEVDANDGTNPPAKSSFLIDDDDDDDDDDYEDEEYDEDDHENGEIIGRKRGRKPIKARSLKSLM